MEQNNRYSWLWQGLTWSGLWLLLSLILSGGNDDYSRILNRNLIVSTGMFVFTVVNVSFLFPQFYLPRKLWLFALVSILLIGCITWLVHSDFMPWAELMSHRSRRFDKIMDPLRKAHEMRPRGNRGDFIRNVRWFKQAFPFLITLLGSTLVEATKLANRKEKEVIRSDKEKLETELKFLKSQVNPHFLFNVLNNIYTLAVIKSDKAPDSLLQLSTMLRYMLYDSNETHVSLKQEIGYLKNYVELYRLKDSRGLNITLNLDESRPEMRVAPLLFIPFLENAFKHSQVEDLDNGFIKADLTTEPNAVQLVVENSIPKGDLRKDKVGGIGLKNIQKRLALIYPNQHELKIEQSETEYKIFLRIESE